MKKITKIVSLSILAAALFVGCKPTTDTPVSDPASPAAPETPDTPETPAAPAATVIWTGSCALAWDGGESIDHEKFSSDVKKVRVTFTTTNDPEYAAIKFAVCDPWGDVTPTNAEGGTIQADSSVGVELGQTDATLTVSFDEATITKFIGQGTDGAWGGMKFYGYGATVTKVEILK